MLRYLEYIEWKDMLSMNYIQHNYFRKKYSVLVLLGARTSADKVMKNVGPLYIGDRDLNG